MRVLSSKKQVNFFASVWFAKEDGPYSEVFTSCSNIQGLIYWIYCFLNVARAALWPQSQSLPFIFDHFWKTATSQSYGGKRYANSLNEAKARNSVFSSPRPKWMSPALVNAKAWQPKPSSPTCESEMSRFTFWPLAVVAYHPWNQAGAALGTVAIRAARPRAGAIHGAAHPHAAHLGGEVLRGEVRRAALRCIARHGEALGAACRRAVWVGVEVTPAGASVGAAIPRFGASSDPETSEQWLVTGSKKMGVFRSQFQVSGFSGVHRSDVRWPNLKCQGSPSKSREPQPLGGLDLREQTWEKWLRDEHATDGCGMLWPYRLLLELFLS